MEVEGVIDMTERAGRCVVRTGGASVDGVIAADVGHDDRWRQGRAGSVCEGLMMERNLVMQLRQ